MNDTLFDKAFVKVKLLSTIFRANENRYLSPAYQEAEVRRDFIDKFFAALGWDVNNARRKNMPLIFFHNSANMILLIE